MGRKVFVSYSHEDAYECRWNTPDLSAPLRQKNSYR